MIIREAVLCHLLGKVFVLLFRSLHFVLRGDLRSFKNGDIVTATLPPAQKCVSSFPLNRTIDAFALKSLIFCVLFAAPVFLLSCLHLH